MTTLDMTGRVARITADSGLGPYNVSAEARKDTTGAY